MRVAVQCAIHDRLHVRVYIAKGAYHDPELELDYAGFDSYPGTWRKGGAESWDAHLDEFYALTKKPIIIQDLAIRPLARW